MVRESEVNIACDDAGQVETVARDHREDHSPPSLADLQRSPRRADQRTKLGCQQEDFYCKIDMLSFENGVVVQESNLFCRDTSISYLQHCVRMDQEVKAQVH
eukprot:Skav217019  [mRNA]  locus=scaffold1803:271399:273211:+ [translate_table: standard]